MAAPRTAKPKKETVPKNPAKGKAETPPPVAPERKDPWRNRQFDPIRSLSPQALMGQVTQWQAGRIAALNRTLYAILERDDTISTAHDKARRAVAKEDWEITTARDGVSAGDPKFKEQYEFLAYFLENLECADAQKPDEVGGWETFLWHAMTAKVYGFAKFATTWKMEGGEWLTARFDWIPAHFFNGEGGPLRFARTPMGETSYEAAEELDPQDWFGVAGDGIAPRVAILWALKFLPLNDWIDYCADYGFPIIDAETTADRSAGEFNELVEAVTEMRRTKAIVRQEGREKVSIIEMARHDNPPFTALIERADRLIFTAFTGSDLSSMAKENANGQLGQLDDKGATEKLDSQRINAALRRLARDLITWRFGADADVLAVPRIRRPRDLRGQIELVRDLVQMDFPVTLGQAAEIFGIRLPEGQDPEQTLNRLEGGAASDMRKGGGNGEGGDPTGTGAQSRGDQRSQQAAGDVGRDVSEGRGGQAMMGDQRGSQGNGQGSAANARAVNGMAEYEPELYLEALSLATGAARDWLAPLAAYADELAREVRQRGGTMSPADLAAFLDAAAERVPELAADLQPEVFADALESIMGTAAIRGAADSIRAEREAGKAAKKSAA